MFRLEDLLADKQDKKKLKQTLVEVEALFPHLADDDAERKAIASDGQYSYTFQA